ncbi:sigma-54-dependent Fis family transcriptional regulator [Cupriavidus sp. USMAA2-4]|uniref:Sigma-54-dependent Fis family transcriptional regulator n=1 Tax=Cupriavidus malaysiensis TaxID=367825 RepID=A0A1D9HYN2_9BURK|nr:MULTISPECIES: sigma-54 dependent transcriptional regulator [Cupriavidus]AOY91910.1 sigma-54-dependent Fis family transcriptional regulator [Cupriavidus sp. USMAA2-4]AOY98531.1 sigma-54-dependent Fis family transcriptional regulator [Cupriavidus sp. USMAHM13]AOZ04961.1 sigma-54-dependent Fis family transcriptional regulator [Cupriavidus malaysiensis]
MQEGLRVLFVEDEPLVRQATAQSLELAGFSVLALPSAEAAMPHLAADFPGVLVTDVRLSGASGLDLLHHCRNAAPGVPVILVTGHGDITMAVQAMREGAYDFIEKPFGADRLTDTVRRALERRALELENRALRRELAGPAGSTRIIGRSPAIEQVRALVANVAPTDVPVMINGETGTGKELVARSLHALSTRHDGPFIALNCGAVPEAIFESEMFGHEAGAFTGAGKRRIGKLEHASGGTLFLDEIESMPLALQVKLLRVLQEGMLERLGSNTSIPIDVRIVAAAKGDMEALVAQGAFRQDLYYRLNVVTIPLPPLRERREDIVSLFEHFMLVAAVRYQRPVPLLAEAQRQALMQRPWPGNVRELRNAADRLVLGVPEGGAAAAAADDGMPLKERMERYERALIADTLARTGGAVSQAADLLQVGKATLYEKIKRYGL